MESKQTPTRTKHLVQVVRNVDGRTKWVTVKAYGDGNEIGAKQSALTYEMMGELVRIEKKGVRV